MRGWQIFTHSAGLVFRNLPVALRLSLVPYCAHLAAQLYLFVNPDLVSVPSGLGGDLPQVEPAQYGIFLLLQIASLVASLWIAVAWHRYVLTEEFTAGWLPPLRGDLVLGYFGRSVMLGLLVLIAMLIVAIPAGVFMTIVPAATIALLLVTVVVGFYIFLRLGVILPAGAVDRKMTLRQAWTATGSEQRAILGLCLVSVGFIVLLQIPLILVPDGNSAFGLVYGLAFGWLATMVGSSVLTSLYGICVEKRSID